MASALPNLYHNKTPNDNIRINTNTNYLHDSRNLNSRSPIPLESDSLTSKEKRDYNRKLYASFSSDSGFSVEELLCDEIDDILPKTDYTYAKTATYSKKYISKTKYISPNMSRRKIRGGSSMLAVSDDEEDTHDNVFENQATSSSSLAHNNLPLEQTNENSAEKISQAKPRQRMLTSTPKLDAYSISAHDHYYDGMVLRSGSRIKGQKYFNGQPKRSERQITSHRLPKNSAITELAAKSKSSMDGNYQSKHTAMTEKADQKTYHRTTTTTTITTYEDISDEHEESKQRHDQSETEKGKQDHSEEYRYTKPYQDQITLSQQGKEYYKIHLYGLDADEYISDVDELDWSSISKTVSSSSSAKTEKDSGGKKRSTLSKSQNTSTERFASSHFQSSPLAARAPWYILITTYLTSVRTSIAESISDGVLSSMIKSTSEFLWNTVSAPAVWILRLLSSLSNWLIIQSHKLVLWDIETKHRKHRGCCCLFLPLLFLLPFLLLGGYYVQDALLNSGSHLSNSTQVLGSMFSFLWFTTRSDKTSPYLEIPSSQLPMAASNADIDQVNITDIYQYIQQTVIQATADHRDYQPVGLNNKQVEEIVRLLLATELKGVNWDVNDKIASLKALITKDDENFKTLESKLKDLQKELKFATSAHQAMTESLLELKKIWESSKSEQTSEWQAAFEAQKQKVLDLSAQVASLSSQNAALTAMMSNCCKNNSMIDDMVRAQTLAILSQMSTDSSGLFADVVNKSSNQFVEREELHERLAALSSQIMGKLETMLASLEKETVQSANENVVQTSLVGAIDEVAVKSIVEEALMQFSADRVAMPDFALESAGGSVLSVRCSETFYKKTALVSIFGIPLWYTSNSPRTVIQPDVNPGECWAFKGTTGYLVIRLSHPVQPTGFTLEHLSKSLSPKGDISSAPRDFTVFGLKSENDYNGASLGNYTYLDNRKPIQFFPVQNQHPGIFQHIELRISSNHGNPEYTCLYRFRVHGLP